MTTTNDHADAIKTLTEIGEDLAGRGFPTSDARRMLDTYSYGPSASRQVTDDECDEAIREGYRRHDQAVLDEQARANLINDDAILTLAAKAALAGDTAMLLVCERALEGSDKDRAECARVIADARAMEG